MEHARQASPLDMKPSDLDIEYRPRAALTNIIINGALIQVYDINHVYLVHLYLQSGLHLNMQSSCTSDFTGLHLHTLLTSFVRWQMSRLVGDSVPVHLRH